MLNVRVAKIFVPYQNLENMQMLCGFLDTPNLFVDHIRRFSNSLTTQMVFGFRVTRIDDVRLKKLFHCVEKLSEVMGSTIAAVLDLYPVLRRLPDFLVPMRSYCKELHREEITLFRSFWMEAKGKIINKTIKVHYQSVPL
jgi:hypothetical protein